MQAARGGVVAGPAHPRVEPEPRRLGRDPGLCHVQQRRVHGEAIALDASLGGIGGCPFAPNATGNIPTEDLAYLLARMGVATGLDLEALTDIVPWIEAQLGKRVPGLLSKAGLFPAA